MILRRLLTITILLTSTMWSQAQQINAVPDYVFRNQMSVGRNAVTDTAAYFSIGPRYGATKGFMPPIVGDTATFSSGKRNGLLIFSVQKNKFLYWDSVRVQWSDMAGGSGSYILAGDTASMLSKYLRKSDTTAMILPYLRKADTTSMLTAYLRKGDTASMLSPYYRSATASAALALKLNISDTSSMLGNYIRHAGFGLTKSGQSFLVDTLNIATRAWRQKGLDSLAALEVSGSGTTNYVAKFTAGSTIGNSQIFDNGTNVGINTASPASRLHAFGTSGATTIIAEGATNNAAYGRLEMRGRPQSANQSTGYIVAASTEGGQAATNIGAIDFAMSGAGGNAHYMAFSTHNGTSLGERLRIFANGRVFVGASPTDAGYQLDVNGTGRFAGALRAQGTIQATNNNDNNSGDFTGMVIGSSTGGTARTASFIKNTSSPYDFTIRTQDNTATTTGSMIFQNGSTETMRITSSGNVGINQNSPSYLLDINGTLRSVNGANFATTSGNVGIGTATASSVSTARLSILGSGVQDSYIQVMNGAGGGFLMGSLNGTGMQFYTLTGTQGSESGTKRMEINSNGEVLINPGSDAGDYKLQVSGNVLTNFIYTRNNTDGLIFGTNGAVNPYIQGGSDNGLFIGTSNTPRINVKSGGNVLIGTTTDAGYKLDVNGNTRVTGKIDVASNTVYGLGVARSGTSEVAGQIYNSSGILYFGAESSTGGGIFSGSSAYAGVIGTGANYPLQFAVNNITRGGFSTSGNLLLGFTTDSYFLKLQVNGSIFSNNQFFGQGANAQLSIDSSANISPLYVSAHSLTGTSAQAMLYSNTTWNTTGNPSLLDLNITNTASGATSNYIKITDGTNTFRVTKAAEVVTAAPSGGSIKPWKLGEAATVSPTSPNRTIRVEIDGTVYYLHAKTTND